jgi:hypothetical protein
MLLAPALRMTPIQTPFAMFPVLQPAFPLGTLKLADGYILGYLCDRNLQPVKQFPEHGDPPWRQPVVSLGSSRILVGCCCVLYEF